jgi:hypothetical protein
LVSSPIDKLNAEYKGDEEEQKEEYISEAFGANEYF